MQISPRRQFRWRIDQFRTSRDRLAAATEVEPVELLVEVRLGEKAQEQDFPSGTA